MTEITNFLRTDLFLYILSGITIVMIILYISNSIQFHQLKTKYSKFMKKIGNGKDIDEMLEKYIQRVEEVDKENKEIERYCEKLDKDILKCIEKIGVVRYSAFKDTGSDLSFALALLDGNNDGVVLNGIYSREMSNIYAKPIQNANSNYTLSEEEKEAIQRAIQRENG